MNRNWSNQKPIPPSKPKREITKITNRHNTMRTHDQPSGQLFPKSRPLSNPNRTKSIMNKHKVKRHRKTLYLLSILSSTKQFWHLFEKYVEFIFVLIRVQCKYWYVGVNYNNFKGIHQNRGWCIQVTVEL